MQIELWTWDLWEGGTPTAQDCHPVETKTGRRVRHNEAAKLLNPLKYKTPDILEMLAAKMTLLQF